MAKKYIDVKLKRLYSEYIHIPDPEKNLIFCYQWFDTMYDRESEDMGNFYDAAYIKDDEVVWECENSGDFKSGFGDEDEFMEKIERDSPFSLYINKNKKKDIKVTTDKDGYFVIIYKDKYRFSYNPSEN